MEKEKQKGQETQGGSWRENMKRERGRQRESAKQESRRQRELERQERGRQRELIREFDKKLQQCTAKGMEPVAKFFIILFEVLITLIMLIPYERGDIKVHAICGLTLVPWPIQMYLAPYLHVTENGKVRSIYEKIRYLPVERKELWRVRMEYLLRFLRIPFLCGMLAQLLGCLLAGQGITIGNILCPLLVTGAYPLLIGLTLIGRRK